MKRIMKKTLSLVLALVMVLALAPMTAKAAPAATPSGTGTGEDPYVVTTDGTTYMVSVEAKGVAFVSTGDVYDATVTGVASTMGEYSFKRGMMDYSPVESVNGEATLTLEGSNMFMVCNLAEEANAIYLQIVGGEGTGAPAGTWDDPEIVTMSEDEWTGAYGASLQVELAEGSQGYYYRYIAEEAGAVLVGVDCADAEWNPVGWMYNVNNTTAGIYGDMHFSDDEEVVYTEIVPVVAGDVIDVFVSTYDPADMWNNPAGIAYVDFAFVTSGSMFYPEEIVAGDYTAQIEEDSIGYFYYWTASEDGKITVTMNDEAGWMYSVDNLTTGIYGDFHWSDDDPVVTSEELTVAEGDEIMIMVNTYDPDLWSAPAGAINWTLSFEAGSAGEEGGSGSEGEEGGSGDEGDDVVTYIEQTTELTLDNEMYVLDKGYDYNVFVFNPTEVGKYTITSGNSKLGIVGYVWVDENKLTDEIVCEDTIVWNCTAVGQSIYVAVTSDDFIANITMEQGEVEDNSIEKIIYENKVKPESFVFTGNTNDLLYVDTFDGVVDEAVLGTDGYYHLNSADGPVLFVNLNDEWNSLASMYSYGNLSYVLYEDGVAVSQTIYTDAFAEYYACVEEETGLYPLTEDLITIFQMVGAHNDWYSGNGIITLGDDEDAWMYACYYLEDLTTLGGASSDDSTGDNAGGETGDNAGGETGGNASGLPQTGDSANVILWVAILCIGVVAVASSIVMRKKNA